MGIVVFLFYVLSISQIFLLQTKHFSATVASSLWSQSVLSASPTASLLTSVMLAPPLFFII